MAYLHILWDKPVDSGTYSGGDWVSGGGLSLDNLKTQDVMELARSTDASEASTQWRVDLGRVTPLSLFAILNHNGSTLATRRFIVRDASLNAVYDTGAEVMRQPTVVWGSQPFGSFPFSGVDETAYPGGPIDLHIAPATVVGRYIDVEISDEANSAGYFQAGRFLAGEAFQQPMQYGVRIRPADPSEVRRTRGGRRLVRNLPGYRTFEAQFQCMSEEDAYGAAFEIERRLKKEGDFLLVYDPEDDPSVLFRRTIYAALVDTTGITEDFFKGYSWGLVAEELI